MVKKKAEVQNSKYRPLIIVAVIAVLVVVLIIATSSSSSKTNPTPTKSVQSSNAIKLTGFGASQSDWDANHTADSRFTTGSAYNPDTKYAQGNSTTDDDEYYAVNALAGSITNYSMRFVSNQTIDEVEPTVLKEFPSDTTVLWEQLLNADSTNSCYQIEVTSPTLAKALGSDGNAFVELFTEPAPSATYSSYYDPMNVNNALFQNLDTKTATDSTGC
jgi:hypothetical protein